MPSARWELLKDLLEVASELSHDEQALYLESATRGDKELLQHIQALLAVSNSDPFLPPPVPAEIEGPLPQDFRVGKTIAGYTIQRLLATGGFSKLYEATRSDGLFSRTVVFKFALLGGVDRFFNGFGEDRLRSEIELLSRLDHRSICRLFDAGTASGEVFAVLEHASEGRFLNHCKVCDLGVGQRLHLFLQLCEAVEYLHNNGWLHCDLKPANVLVRRNGTICLIDFGSAQLIHNLSSQAGSAQKRPPPLTVAYAAPELLSGAVPAVATEIYALGMILHEMSSGGYPYKPSGSLLDQLAGAIQYDSPAPPSEVAKDLTAQASKRYNVPRWPPQLSSQALDDIVLNCLEKVPSDRYVSVANLQEDIRVVLRGDRPAATSRMDVKRSESVHLDKPLKIFLAHCAHDKSRVRELHRKLASIGARPWLDEIDILPGSMWASAIDRAIKTADVLIVCIRGLSGTYWILSA